MFFSSDRAVQIELPLIELAFFSSRCLLLIKINFNGFRLPAKIRSHSHQLPLEKVSHGDLSVLSTVLISDGNPTTMIRRLSEVNISLYQRRNDQDLVEIVSTSDRYRKTTGSQRSRIKQNVDRSK